IASPLRSVPVTRVLLGAGCGIGLWRRGRNSGFLEAEGSKPRCLGYGQRGIEAPVGSAQWVSSPDPVELQRIQHSLLRTERRTWPERKDASQRFRQQEEDGTLGE